MQICRNKHSGKYLIYLSDGVTRGTAIFITPDAKEKILSLDRFEELEDVEAGHENGLLARGLITESQIHAWHEYEKMHSDEFVQELDSKWESLTPYKKREILKMIKREM